MIVWLLDSRPGSLATSPGSRFEWTVMRTWAIFRRALPLSTPELLLVAEAMACRDNALALADEAGLFVSGMLRDPGGRLYHFRIRPGAQKALLQAIQGLGEAWETRGREASVHERYRKLLNRVSDGLLELDGQDLIRWSNSSLQKSLGVDDLVGLSLEQIVKPSDVAQLRMLRRQHSAGVVAAVPVSLVNGQVVELDPNLRLAADGTVLGSSLVLRGIKNAKDSDRGRELFVLYTVATLLSQATTVEQALETVLQRILELMDLAAAGACLQGGLPGQVRGLTLEQPVLDWIHGFCESAQSERKPVIYRHLGKETGVAVEGLKAAGLLGLAVIPLQVQGELIGCLWFVSTDPGHFSREVVSLLISLSIPLAVSISNFRHVADQLHEEASRRQFYRDALQAVTQGKLFLCEPRELADTWGSAGSSAGERIIRSYADVPGLRHFVEETLLAEGFSEERCHDMALCATEAAGNVVKHAESGRLEIKVQGEDAWILIEDRGPGIDFAHLPSAVLTAGYSTAPSLGMGYSILLEMADALYLCTHGGGTSVLLMITRKVVDPLEAFASLELL